MASNNEASKAATLHTAEALEHFFAGIGNMIVHMHAMVHAAIENVGRYPAAAGAEDWADLHRVLEDLPRKSKDAMRRVLAQSWFFGWHDGLESFKDLVDRLSAAPDAAIDELMTDYYRMNLVPFAEQLLELYPERSLVIRAAVDAHLTKSISGYCLSVPVFIIQGDGISAKILDEKQPLRDGPKAIRKKYGTDEKLLDLLYPFLELRNSPFAMSEDDRKALGPGDWLNRHEVVHGERSDYGTELNSLKAFSFLVFAGLHMSAVVPDNN